MTSHNLSATDLADRTLTIERVFDAPRDLVYEAITDHEHASNWWAPRWCEVLFLEMDVRPGGEWRKLMRDGQGNDYWRSGKFVEVVPPEWLAFTYYSDDPASEPGHETIVTIKLDELPGGKTRLTLNQAVFESTQARDSHNEGWTSSIDRLGEYVATM